MSGYQHKTSTKKQRMMMNYLALKAQKYQFDFKLCTSKFGANDQQINKLLKYKKLLNKFNIAANL